MILDDLKKAHAARYGSGPQTTVFAPGRVNIIGEHTDYNGGSVMPIALDKGIYVAAAANNDGMLRINSVDFDTFGEFPVASLAPDDTKAWANCPKGIAKVMQDNKLPVAGADITMTGDLPIGAGLSSSAAVEVAVGYAFSRLFGFKVDRRNLALMAQQAEHEFTGTKCGIMDQLISAMGRAECMLKLDCATLATEYIPTRLGEDAFIITNTNVKHNLATSAYNTRREECAAGLAAAQTVRDGLDTLSDFTLDELEANREAFDAVVFKRVLHVLGENKRVADTAAALQQGDTVGAGRLLYASHASLRDDYEVSCAELDWLVDNARGIAGVHGSRMTGGGFGGCTVTLLEKRSIPSYTASLDAYEQKFGKKADVYEAVAGNGVHEIKNDE